MGIFRIMCMLMVVVASSCNKDDVITITLDNENYRAATPSSAEQWDKVWEYTPAPGQFINETKTGGFTGEEFTPEAAAEYAEGRMSDGKFVSLGAISLFVATPLMARRSRVWCGLCRTRMAMESLMIRGMS